MDSVHKAADSYDYEVGGVNYSQIRRQDPHIAAKILAALGDARTVLNVGAGAGSYEPDDRYVVAVEPSEAMRAQRERPAVIARAESLPFDDDAFDASMACLTIHHWPDLKAGLREMRRVTKGPMVLMTFDPGEVHKYWLNDYCPEMAHADGSRFPTIELLRAILGDVAVETVGIPLNCTDGFQEAFYGRPEMLLMPEVRKAQSGWSFVPEGAEARFAGRLAADLAIGEWDRMYGHLRSQQIYEGALRLYLSHR